MKNTKTAHDYLYYCQCVREVADVASNGDKFPKDEAIKLFHEFAEKRYRL